jgi:hypothetical protein
LGDLDVNAKIILKWISKELPHECVDGVMWLGIRTGGDGLV